MPGSNRFTKGRNEGNRERTYSDRYIGDETPEAKIGSVKDWMSRARAMPIAPGSPSDAYILHTRCFSVGLE